MLLLTQVWWATFSYAQETPSETKTDCEACSLTPPELVRYTKFVRSILDTLQSTSKVDYSKIATWTKQANTNLLVDYLKQITDSYLWVFKREWRIIWGQIQWASLQTTKAVSRDFIADFFRQSVAWARSSVLTRDEDLLETIDDSIDKETIIHINNFVYSDPIPVKQVENLKIVFSNYSDIFQTGWNNWELFSPWISYKQMIGWLNFTQRAVKNHIVIRPKNDFKFESNEKVGYSIRSNRGNTLDDAYACATANLWTACNATFGKTTSLRKEFGKSTGKELKTTLNKFKTSFEKLSKLKSKGVSNEYWSTRWVQYRGTTVQDLNLPTKKEIIQSFEERKSLALKILADCTIKGENINTEQYKLYSIQRMWIIPCQVRAPYLSKSAWNVTEAEEAKAVLLSTTMNNTLTKVMNMEDYDNSLSTIALPLSTTLYFPELSKLVYKTKGTVKELNANSVQGCLAFCTNLNTQVNCGSQ